MNSSRWSSARWMLDEQEPVEAGGVDGSPWRLEEVDGGDEQYPVESRFVVRHTPPNRQDPVWTVGGRREVHFLILQYATPLPVNRIPFRPLAVEHKAVSSVLRYAMPHFYRMFRPSWLAPDEHEDDVVSPFQPRHVHEPWPYVCASRHSRHRPYVHIRGRIFFLAPCRCTYVYMLRARLYYDTCPSLLGHGSSLQPADRQINQYVRTRSRPE